MTYILTLNTPQSYLHPDPKYSPELNSIKLVFFLLKWFLNTINDTTNLLTHIFDALEKIKSYHVIAFYKKRGYFYNCLIFTEIILNKRRGRRGGGGGGEGGT